MRTFTALLAALALATPVFANSDVAWVPNDAKRCDRSNGHTSGCPKTVRIAAKERVEIQVGGKRQLRVEKNYAAVTVNEVEVAVKKATITADESSLVVKNRAFVKAGNFVVESGGATITNTGKTTITNTGTTLTVTGDTTATTTGKTTLTSGSVEATVNGPLVATANGPTVITSNAGAILTGSGGVAFANSGGVRIILPSQALADALPAAGTPAAACTAADIGKLALLKIATPTTGPSAGRPQGVLGMCTPQPQQPPASTIFGYLPLATA